MAERLTPERISKMRSYINVARGDSLSPAEQCQLFNHIDAQQIEIGRLTALLGEAREALVHVDKGPDPWSDCCRQIVAPMLAKLSGEAERG